MINKRKTPDSAATPSGGLEQNTQRNSNLFKFPSQTQKDGCQLAKVLVGLERDFPDFFRDVKPDDPDLDMDKVFKSYEQIMRKADDS